MIMNSQTDLKNRVVIITGAAHGLGKVFAEAFVGAGAKVVIADILEQAGEKLAHSLGGNAVFCKVDLTQKNEIESLIELTIAKWGQLDIVINNARPKLQKTPGAELPCGNLMDAWNIGMDVLLKAPALLVESALPYLRKSKHPVILNISSTNAVFIAPQPLVYHAAKAGLDQMTRFLAYFLGPHGIRVVGIAPGIIDLFDENAPLTSRPINKKTADLAVPLKKAATADDIARAALFLCSDHASYFTGQTLRLDGGITLGDQFHVVRNALNDKGTV
jgi:3-oxoacyl-[acyl-carrier protein] reductase